MLYVTDRCVFRLTPHGLELTEIAPGVDLRADILARMDFEPVIPTDPVLMDARIFRPEPMGIAEDLLTVPLHVRFAYDADRNLFFLNLEGMSVTTAEQVEAVASEVDRQLAAVGKRVHMIVNYDNFILAPHLVDDYLEALRGVADKYYAGVTRYTTSAFLRLKLGDMLGRRGVAPHVYESRQEAVSWADQRLAELDPLLAIRHSVLTPPPWAARCAACRHKPCRRRRLPASIACGGRHRSRKAGPGSARPVGLDAYGRA